MGAPPGFPPAPLGAPPAHILNGGSTGLAVIKPVPTLYARNLNEKIKP